MWLYRYLELRLCGSHISSDDDSKNFRTKRFASVRMCSYSLMYAHLTDLTNQVLMRGRNSVTKSKNRRGNPAAYQDSTALEALIGYIYITDKDRCTELLAWLESVVDIREVGDGKQ